MFALGFRNKSFKFPSSNQTYTIRPLEQVYEAKSGVEIRALVRFQTKALPSGFTLINGKHSFEEISYLNKSSITSSYLSSDRLSKRQFLANSLQVAENEGKQVIHTKVTGQAFSTTQQVEALYKDFSQVSTGRFWLRDASAGNKLLQHQIKLPDRLFYWWDKSNTDTSKYNSLCHNGT